MDRLLRNAAFLIGAWLGLVFLPAEAASVAAARTSAGNVYLSGDDVRVAEPVPGDLFAAGRRVTVEQGVGADAAIAGGTVQARGGIGQDLRAAGGTVTIDSAVKGDLVAAGGTVKVAAPSVVSGSALIAAGHAEIDGTLAQGAKIYAGRISVSGRIAGNTRLYGRELSLVPGAKIDGDLTYASANPLPPEQLALVTGRVVREKTPEDWTAADRSAPAAGWFHPGFFLSMLVCGSLLYFLFPNAVIGARQTIKRHPLRSLLTGLALLFTVPPVAVLFIITLVGIPIGLGLLALYPLLLLLGYLATAFFIGREAADVMKQPEQVSAGRQILFLALALLILAIAAMVPVLGALAMFIALVTGIGGWAGWLHQRYRGGSPREAESTGV